MDEVFSSPEGSALIEQVDDPRRATSLRLLKNPIRFDGQALTTRLPPPVLGEHTDEILRGT
jgi:crotonobetainyl-CoA:carnitine CoA-transferase CaiB-like acyl-CoA transferase